MLGPVDVVLLQRLFLKLVVRLVFGTRRLRRRRRLPGRVDLLHLGPGLELGRAGRGPEVSEVGVVGHFPVFGRRLGDNLALKK